MHCQQGEQIRQVIEKPTTINIGAPTPKHMSDNCIIDTVSVVGVNSVSDVQNRKL